MPNCNSFAALPIYIMFTLHNNAKMLKWYVAYDGGGRTLHETFAVLLYMPAGKKTCYFNLFFFAMKYEKKKIVDIFLAARVLYCYDRLHTVREYTVKRQQLLYHMLGGSEFVAYKNCQILWATLKPAHPVRSTCGRFYHTGDTCKDEFLVFFFLFFSISQVKCFFIFYFCASKYTGIYARHVRTYHQ